MAAAAKVTALAPVSNDAEDQIGFSEPYSVAARVVGTAPILFHRWSVESVAAKAASAKGSKAKKSDDVDSYVYRDEDNMIAIPSEYFRMAIIHAAKFRQDPRSPRKSAMDLFKAGIATTAEFCSLGKEAWDYLDQRRVMVQRNGITRSRPAMQTGWETTVGLQVLLPEYIEPSMLNEVLQAAGRLIGVGDFRPSYGRFQVTAFAIR
jgi:hypothetical protein